MSQIIEVGYIRSAAYELTRPSDTTAYAVGDALANSTTAGSVVPLEFEVARADGGTGKIIGSRLLTSSATAFGAVRLWLFNRQPFAAAGYQADNAAIALTYAACKTGSAVTAPKNNLIGYVDFSVFTALSSSAVSIGESNQPELDFMCDAGTKLIYGLLEVKAVFTPASAQTFTAVLSSSGVA